MELREIRLNANYKEWDKFTAEVRSHTPKALFYYFIEYGENMVLGIKNSSSEYLGKIVWSKSKPDDKFLCFYLNP